METPRNMRATGTILVSRFVKMDPAANNSVLQAAANNNLIGISSEAGRVAPIPEVTTDPPQAAIATEMIRVYGAGECCLLRIGSGGCVPGDRLKSGANGEGIALTLAQSGRVGAIALEAASEDEYAMVQVHIFNQNANAS